MKLVEELPSARVQSVGAPGGQSPAPKRAFEADRATVQELLERPMQVVAGKGGVGRTVVACAIALRLARNGNRTLLLEANAPDNAARYLEVEPAVDTPREVLNNLWLCRMTQAGALHEYALMVLRFRTLYSLVFENPLVRYLLRSIPSLGEFTMMGKTWYHSTERLSNGRPRFDRIVLDAPATGHAVTLLSVSRVVAETVPVGTMKSAAERMASLIESPSSACLHVVALPEEMPVNEGIELASAARGKLRMPAGLAIVNRVLEPLVSEADRGMIDRLRARAESIEAIRPYADAARRRLEWESTQREHIERLARGTRMPVVEIPELPAGAIGRDRLADIVSALDLGASAASIARRGNG